MIFLVYVLFLIAISIYLKLSKNKNRRLILLLFHFAFLFTFFITLQIVNAEKISIISGVEVLLEAIYTSLRSMTFNKDFLDFENSFYYFGNIRTVKIEIWIISMISSVLTVHFFAITFLEEKINQIKLKLKLKFENEVIFIAGDNENILELNRSILSRNKNKVVVLFLNPEKKIDFIIPENMIIENIGNLKKWIEKTKSFKNKKINVSIIYTDQNFNMGILGMLEKYFSNDLDINENLKLTILCHNEYLRFSKWNTKIDSYFVSKEHMISRKLLIENNLINVLKQRDNIIADSTGFLVLKKDICVGVFGFTELARELFLLTYENSRFLKEDGSESSYMVDIFHENEKLEIETFLQSLDYFIKLNKINFINTRNEYIENLQKEIGKYDVIYFAYTDDEKNIKDAWKLVKFIEMENILPRPQIYVFIEKWIPYLQEFRNLIYPEHDYIKIINTTKEFFTYSNLISREIEKESKVFHDNYNKIKLEGNKSSKIQEYKELDTFAKASNRAQVHDNLLKELMIDKEGFLLKNININEVKLAMYEHSRWLAFHISRGWSPLLPEMRTKMEIDNGLTKRASQNKHLCLVSWNELKKINMKGEKNLFQEYNIEQAKIFIKNKKNLSEDVG